MRRRVIPTLILLASAQVAMAEPASIRLVEFDGPITPASAPRIIQAIDEAQESGDELVLIQLDTPGGLVSSTDKIIKRMLSSRVPVVVWVGPSGARAASAGFMILVAADVAAMAPGTRTGAASTVSVFGENKDDDVMLRKMNEDMAALMRSIAERRGRDVQASEDAIFHAKAYEESVALSKGLVDLLAPTREELLDRLDGREVILFDGSSVTLHTADRQFVITEFSWRQNFLEFLGTPVVAFFLLMIGLGGLYVEFTQPGVVFPGVVGMLALVLFAFSAQLLPVSAIGMLLIGLSIVMFVLEVKVASFGMLTLAGSVCLILGSLLLIDGPIPELRVPMGTVIPTVIVLVLVIGFIVRLAVRAQRSRVGTGVEGLVTKIGTAIDELAPEGKVFVHGEIWNAASNGGPIAAQSRVRVVGVDHLQLTVEPADRSQIARS